MAFNIDIGTLGENAVCEHLTQEGFDILVRNFAVHNVGELDIVAIKDDDVYVIEVKTRSLRNTMDYGSPEVSISSSKLRKIRNTVRHLTARYGLYDKNIIIAAGAVLHDGKGKIVSVEIIEL